MKLTLQDLKYESLRLRESYRLQLEQTMDLLVLAQTRFSTHDAFNLSSRAQDLQGLAAQIQTIDNLIFWEEKP